MGMDHTSHLPFNITAADAQHHQQVLIEEAAHRRLVRIARAARRRRSDTPPQPPPPTDTSDTRVPERAEETARNRRYAVSR